MRCTDMRNWLAILILTVTLWAPAAEARRARHVRQAPFVATMYSQHGQTKDGNTAHTGCVAADTRVLPLGTKIRVTNAGPYSGIYTVRDTGGRIRGRRIDIFTPSRWKARRFGRKVVRVTVLEWGEGNS